MRATIEMLGPLAIVLTAAGCSSSTSAENNEPAALGPEAPNSDAFTNGSDASNASAEPIETGEEDALYVRPAVIPETMKGMIAAEDRENEKCRGGAGDSPETMQACNRRQVLLKELEDNGLCWGGASIGADMHWIRCRDDQTYEPGHFDEPYYNEAEISEVSGGA